MRTSLRAPCFLLCLACAPGDDDDSAADDDDIAANDGDAADPPWTPNGPRAS